MNNGYSQSKISRKDLQSDYNPYHFDRPMVNSSRSLSNGTRYVSFLTDSTSMGIRLAGGDKHGLFICEVQPNSVAHQAGLMVADKIFSVRRSNSLLIIINDFKSRSTMLN